MANIKIIGKHKTLSKKEIRAMAHACSVVMEFHNKTLSEGNEITIELKHKRSMGKARKSKKKNDWAVGVATRDCNYIELARWKDFQTTLSIMIHEMIHIYFEIDDDHSEKATCILTDRLKPVISNIYEELIDGVYVRAAYFAHANISYKTSDGEDAYDNVQWKEIPVDNEAGEKLRKKKVVA